MSARELFLRAGVSQRLYDAFLQPVLIALLFVPLEQLSAATALAVLYNYVLAHQPDFDVRWARGSVAETIFLPWVAAIKCAGGRVWGGMKVRRPAQCRTQGVPTWLKTTILSTLCNPSPPHAGFATQYCCFGSPACQGRNNTFLRPHHHCPLYEAPRMVRLDGANQFVH